VAKSRPAQPPRLYAKRTLGSPLEFKLGLSVPAATQPILPGREDTITGHVTLAPPRGALLRLVA
jgi:hypothetical protein